MSIPLYQPLLGDSELVNIEQVLARGVLTQGECVEQFEQGVARVAGVAHAVAVNSGTAALHVALAGLGVKPGDEVIVPAFTWVSTAHAVEYLGATPVFCDIDIKTFNLDLDQVSRCVTDKTVGIMPVHQFGLPATMDTLMRIAQERELWVLEDAAGALGASHMGRAVGSFGAAACFSFHPRKIITTGEGGAIVTNDTELAERMRGMRQLGIPTFDTLAYNYRLSEIHAAVGVAQLDRLSGSIVRRQQQARMYDELLEEYSSITTPGISEGYSHIYQAYVCMLDENSSRDRDAVMTALAEKGITVRAGTHAPPLLPYYMKKYGYAERDFPQAYLAAQWSLALPIFDRMTQEQQETVVRELHVATMPATVIL